MYNITFTIHTETRWMGYADDGSSGGKTHHQSQPFTATVIARTLTDARRELDTVLGEPPAAYDSAKLDTENGLKIFRPVKSEWHITPSKIEPAAQW